MFKISLNQIELCFRDSKFTSSEIDESILIGDLNHQLVQQLLERNHNAKVNVICESLPNDMLTFLNIFQSRTAAGGVVFNRNKELLWIKRLGKWDLPKGHVELNESVKEGAIREVQEECNLEGLKIEKELETTYHVYTYKSQLVLKKTHWFLMCVDHDDYHLVPQTEEGITEVCFKTLSDSKECLKNTYGNLKLLLKKII